MRGGFGGGFGGLFWIGFFGASNWSADTVAAAAAILSFAGDGLGVGPSCAGGDLMIDPDFGEPFVRGAMKAFS